MRRLAVALFLLASTALPQTPKRYTVNRATAPIRIDGRLDDAAWGSAAWTDDFIDIQGPITLVRGSGPAPRWCGTTNTQRIAAELEEPNVWATLTNHDSVIFRDNDFEVFLNPSGDGRNYFEFEINALNTSWDLFLNKPYREGGKADNSWDIPGLLTAVQVNGTINNPRDRDRGWTVEIAFPWTAFVSRAPVKRPNTGDEWRINFSRVEWQTNIVGGKV